MACQLRPFSLVLIRTSLPAGEGSSAVCDLLRRAESSTS